MVNMKDIYDTDAIIRHVLHSGVDISPADHKAWAMFCCSLRVLGYDLPTFAALSWNDPKTQKLCSQVWNSHRNPGRYKTEDSAKGMIVDLAKSAGVEVKRFLLSRNQDSKPTLFNYRARTLATRRTYPTRPEPTPAPDFLPMDAVRATQKHVKESALFVWLAMEFGEQSALHVLDLYKVGGSKHIAPNGLRASSFPYINTNQEVVDCKLFHIDPITGSRKTASPIRVKADGSITQSSWALPELNFKRRRLNLLELNRGKWCNFGDHLLKDRPTAEIGIVESEKTALIAALTYPDKIWIAVGSKNNLTTERCAPYMGRRLILFPDRDNYNDKPRKDGHGTEKGWRTIARDLAKAGFKVRLDTTTERHEGSPNDDIADLVLRYRHGVQPPPPPPPQESHPAKSPDLIEAGRAFDMMKAKNPALSKFAESLELTAVSVKSYNPETEWHQIENPTYYATVADGERTSAN